MPITSTTSLKLDSSLKERLKKVAATQRRTSHWIMREAIETYIEREEKRELFRLETLAALDHYQATGLHLTEREVDDWLAKREAGEAAELPECHV